jgi:eukaryotic-like serine/threonine-protein kinase
MKAAKAIPLEHSAAPAAGELPGATVAIKALLLIDLVRSTDLIQRLGDAQARQVFARHDQLARGLLPQFEGREIDKTDGFLLLFDRPIQAVGYAVTYQRQLAALGETLGVPLVARAGIHLGEVFLHEHSLGEVAQGAKPLEVEGLAKHTVARVAGLAQAGQVLLTQAAFDLARRGAVGDPLQPQRCTWLAHGPYQLQGIEEAVEIFEVGFPGSAPLSAPPDTPKARRAVAAGDEETLGWRPAAGQEVPWRHYWLLERKLGEGGFGEVWLARQEKTGDHRVFKFCYDAARLHALKREVTLFRILKDSLGERDDIARVLDWNFKEAPFFLEAEYNGTDLPSWVEEQAGAAAVPLATRLEIVAQVATALGAAHSIGVLHKDIKPSNILIAVGAQGAPKARLTDFGIGLLTDSGRLASNITLLGLTEMTQPTSSGGWTRLYAAPELLEGKVPSIQSDLYALGVVLFQMVVGDLTRALAPGWEREVTDDLLAEDIAHCVDGDPGKRPRSALEIAERLRQLEERREARAAAQRAEREARETQVALQRARWRRRLLLAFTSLVLIFALAMALQIRHTAQEAARANREAEAARQISDFLVGLFEIADPDASLGQRVTAHELLDRGALRIKRELQDQPAVRATLIQTMASAYVKLGLYEPAVRLQREALETRERIFGPQHLLVAESLQDLSVILTQQGSFNEAEKLLERALAIRRRILGENDLSVARTIRLLADLKLEHGEEREAERLYHSVLTILDTNNVYVSEDRAESLNDLALIREDLGHGEGIEQLYDEALTLWRKIGGNEHTSVAKVLGNKGRWLMGQHRFREAEACYEEALAIKRKRLGSDHPSVAFTLYKLAELMNAEGSFGKAEALARESLSILERRLPAKHWRIAFAKAVLGDALRGQGRFAEAEPLLVESYPLLRAGTGAQADQTRSTLANIVTLYEAWSKPAEAERYRKLLRSSTAPSRPEGGEALPQLR